MSISQSRLTHPDNGTGSPFTLSCIHLYCACTTVPAPGIDPYGLPWHKSIGGRKSKEEDEGDKGIIMASVRARNTYFGPTRRQSLCCVMFSLFTVGAACLPLCNLFGMWPMRQPDKRSVAIKWNAAYGHLPWTYFVNKSILPRCFYTETMAVVQLN